jgi:Cu(I)/Ag(I) efflux system membrane protein CusA/SilA
MREERDSIEAIERIFVPTPAGEQIPITQLADIQYVRGPQAIRAEDTFLTSYVLFDRVADISEMAAVEAAKTFIDAELERGTLRVPEGVSFEFAGTYENQVKSEARIAILIPLALLIVFALIYLQFQRVSTALIIFSGVIVAVSGGFIALWLYAQPGFLNVDLFGESMRTLFQVDTVNLSVAVWIGLIALIGIATDDGVIMATYLRDKFKGAASELSIQEIRAKTVEAGTRRIRACLMTTATTLLALLPVISSRGRGADVMVPMALPLIGGMGVALLTLFVVPTLYCAVEERRGHNADEASR